MVELLVYKTADNQENQCIESTECMIFQRWDLTVNYNAAEVFDEHLHRIQQEHSLTGL